MLILTLVQFGPRATCTGMGSARPALPSCIRTVLEGVFWLVSGPADLGACTVKGNAQNLSYPELRSQHSTGMASARHVRQVCMQTAIARWEGRLCRREDAGQPMHTAKQNAAFHRQLPHLSQSCTGMASAKPVRQACTATAPKAEPWWATGVVAFCTCFARATVQSLHLPQKVPTGS